MKILRQIYCFFAGWLKEIKTYWKMYGELILTPLSFNPWFLHDIELREYGTIHYCKRCKNEIKG